MNEGTVLVTIKREVATVTINRPDVHNAFDDAVISRLTQELRSLSADKDVRVIVLTGRGESFCAGADLKYMKRTAKFTQAENEADAQALADLLSTLNDTSKPTLALVQGAAYGGGVGLACACDIVVAGENAVFSFSEVKLGLAPAVISPYAISKIGASQARRYFLTGERISAAVAQRIGLVHEVVPDEALGVRGETIAKMLMQGGPDAQAEIKSLIHAVQEQPIGPELSAENALRIARIRASDEGQEGIASFLDKRKPRWCDS